MNTDNQTLTVRAMQNDTVAKLCHRHLGSTANDIVAQTYELNPEITQLPPHLPMGQIVQLPVRKTRPSAETINLWS